MKVYVEIGEHCRRIRQWQTALQEIASECVTNAVSPRVCHCIQFHFFQNDCWRMTVTDNGIPRSGRS